MAERVDSSRQPIVETGIEGLDQGNTPYKPRTSNLMTTYERQASRMLKLEPDLFIGRERHRGHEDASRTTWVRVALFGEMAERLAPTLIKGAEVYVEGTLKLEEWQGRDGVKRAGLSVAASKAECLDQTELGERGFERYKSQGIFKWRGIGLLAVDQGRLENNIPAKKASSSRGYTGKCSTRSTTPDLEDPRQDPEVLAGAKSPETAPGKPLHGCTDKNTPFKGKEGIRIVICSRCCGEGCDWCEGTGRLQPGTALVPETAVEGKLVQDEQMTMEEVQAMGLRIADEAHAVLAARGRRNHIACGGLGCRACEWSGWADNVGGEA